MQNYEDLEQNGAAVLSQVFAVRELVASCGERLKEGFCFGRIINGDTLVLYFTHPILANEFNTNKEHYLTLMRTCYKEKNLKGEIYFTKVKALAKFKKPQELEQKSTGSSYQERAKGDFKITCKNEHSRRILEQIKEIIRRNNDRQSTSL